MPIYVEHDFELTFPHPLTNQEKPFYFFAVIEYEKGEGYTVTKLLIKEGAHTSPINDLIEFCNPNLLKEMNEEAEKHIQKEIELERLW